MPKHCEWHAQVFCICMEEENHCSSLWCWKPKTWNATGSFISYSLWWDDTVPWYPTQIPLVGLRSIRRLRRWKHEPVSQVVKHPRPCLWLWESQTCPLEPTVFMKLALSLLQLPFTALQRWKPWKKPLKKRLKVHGTHFLNAHTATPLREFTPVNIHERHPFFPCNSQAPSASGVAGTGGVGGFGRASKALTVSKTSFWSFFYRNARQHRDVFSAWSDSKSSSPRAWLKVGATSVFLFVSVKP